MRGEQLPPIDTMACGGGVIYLLHFDRPYRHARHYCGWTTNLPERLARHATGHGARLLEVVAAHGIGWQLARTWIGDRHRERTIKDQGGLSRACPICGVTPRGPRNAVVIADLATVDSCSDDRLAPVLVADVAADLAGNPR
jgi:predicted GIY-YIG superfamily endonuclease